VRTILFNAVDISEVSATVAPKSSIAAPQIGVLRRLERAGSNPAIKDRGRFR